MAKQTRKPDPIKAANEQVSEAFALFRNHFAKLSKDLNTFGKRRQQVQEKIQNGARRTTGRIV